jgi:hypothetical protein
MHRRRKAGSAITRATSQRMWRVSLTRCGAKAGLLVTGDEDLLSLKTFQGIRIITPIEYVRRGSGVRN